jgi:hypothetical protein
MMYGILKESNAKRMGFALLTVAAAPPRVTQVFVWSYVNTVPFWGETLPVVAATYKVPSGDIAIRVEKQLYPKAVPTCDHAAPFHALTTIW